MDNRNLKPDEVATIWFDVLPESNRVMGATLTYPQDTYPLRVVEVSKTGKQVKYRRVRNVGADTGHKPTRYEGPYPVWSHDYSAKELVRFCFDTDVRIARWSDKQGCYTDGGTPIRVGTATLYRNYSY